jgi:hypothetical protein
LESKGYPLFTLGIGFADGASSKDLTKFLKDAQ